MEVFDFFPEYLLVCNFCSCCIFVLYMIKSENLFLLVFFSSFCGDYRTWVTAVFSIIRLLLRPNLCRQPLTFLRPLTSNACYNWQCDSLYIYQIVGHYYDHAYLQTFESTLLKKLYWKQENFIFHFCVICCQRPHLDDFENSEMQSLLRSCQQTRELFNG